MRYSILRILPISLLLLVFLSGCTHTRSVVDSSPSSEISPIQSVLEESNSIEPTEKETIPSMEKEVIPVSSIPLMEQLVTVVPAYTPEYNLSVYPYLFSEDPLSVYFVVSLLPPLSDDDKAFSYIMKYNTDTLEWVVSDRMKGYIRSLELFDSLLLALAPSRETVGAFIFHSHDLQSDFVWHNLDHSFEPLAEGKDTLYRIGCTDNSNHYLTAMSPSGELVWKYPAISFMDICETVYYPLQGSFEKEGVFHLFCAEDEELWYVLLDVSTGDVKHRELLQQDMYETWSIRTMGIYPYAATHILRQDNTIFLTGMEKQGTYVVAYTLQEDGLLQEQWKQTYPNLYLHNEDLQLCTVSTPRQLLLSGWNKPYSLKDREGVYYKDNGTPAHLLGINASNGSIVWEDTFPSYEEYTNISQLHDTLVSSVLYREIIYTTSGQSRILHQFSCLDLQQGKAIWEKTFENSHVTYSSFETYERSFLLAPCSQQLYQLDIENNTLLTLNPLNGTTIATYSLPIKKEDYNFSFLCNDQLLLLTMKYDASYQFFYIPNAGKKPA